MFKYILDYLDSSSAGVSVAVVLFCIGINGIILAETFFYNILLGVVVFVISISFWGGLWAELSYNDRI